MIETGGERKGILVMGKVRWEDWNGGGRGGGADCVMRRRMEKGKKTEAKKVSTIHFISFPTPFSRFSMFINHSCSNRLPTYAFYDM